ncbi:hypothetical protein LTR15_008107 [Elasticomyces elasticus]|nr:hypothetical protein LTR15_008107 [Elasticomyces elasticus]
MVGFDSATMERIKTTPPIIVSLPVTQVNTPSAVFDVAELLEMIILYLPMKDMQLSRAVCKAWKNGVDSSIHIEKALFIHPGTPASLAHDVPTWRLPGRYLTSYAAGANDVYTHHPMMVPHLDTFKVQNLAKHAANSLRNVFITSPPEIAALTSLGVWCPEDGIYGRDRVVSLGDAETFGSLHEKIIAKCGMKALNLNDSGMCWDWTDRKREGSHALALGGVNYDCECRSYGCGRAEDEDDAEDGREDGMDEGDDEEDDEGDEEDDEEDDEKNGKEEDETDV